MLLLRTRHGNMRRLGIKVLVVLILIGVGGCKSSRPPAWNAVERINSRH